MRLLKDLSWGLVAGVAILAGSITMARPADAGTHCWFAKGHQASACMSLSQARAVHPDRHLYYRVSHKSRTKAPAVQKSERKLASLPQPRPRPPERPKGDCGASRIECDLNIIAAKAKPAGPRRHLAAIVVPYDDDFIFFRAPRQPDWWAWGWTMQANTDLAWKQHRMMARAHDAGDMSDPAWFEPTPRELTPRERINQGFEALGFAPR